MICCFTCSSSNVVPLVEHMDSSETELPSVKEFLETEKLCQDLCRSIAQNVECTSSSTSLIESQQFPVLMPKIVEGDMEGILNEISELLAVQSGSTGSSDSTDTALLDSNRSVGDILKDAEKLVTMSLAHLNSSMASRTPTPTAQNIKKTDTTSKPTKSNQNSVKFSDVTETIPFQETDISPFTIRSKSDPEIAHSKKCDKPDKKDFHIRPSSSPSPSIISESKSIAKEQLELKLSDLSTVYEDTNTPLENQETSIQENFNNSTNNNNIEEKVDANTETKRFENKNDNDFLCDKLDFLNNKVGTHRKKNIQTEEIENSFILGDQSRLALLEEEVNSQVELIASYQRENERLCADIVKAKEFNHNRSLVP